MIDDLANIIRKHQKTLPNVEPLDVDDEFAQVYKETEDGNLSIKNEMYSCTGLRKVHLEIATSRYHWISCIAYGIQILSLICLFLVQILSLIIMFVSAAITDISPVDGIGHQSMMRLQISADIMVLSTIETSHIWGEIFSPYCKFARLEDDEDRENFCHVVNEYLDTFVSAVWKSTIDYNRADERYDAQINYCKKQKLNDKTRRILANYFGDKWADDYINQVLFDEP